MRREKQAVLSIEVHGSVESIERAARTCYRTEPKGNSESFVQGLKNRRHMAMLEFADVVITLRTSRAIANEIVRHRMGSYAQESTRYVDMARGGQIGIISRCEDPYVLDAWQKSVDAYRQARAAKVPAEIARDVLPLATATVIVCKWNFREALHVLETRLWGATGRPHPDMVELMGLVHEELVKIAPTVFRREQ